MIIIHYMYIVLYLCIPKVNEPLERYIKLFLNLFLIKEKDIL